MRMRTPPEIALAERKSAAQEGARQTLDIMLVDPDEQRSLLTLRDLEHLTSLRCAQKASGREALASFSRARFDAIVVRPNLGDTDCWRWIRMVRSGRFGYAATPILVLCRNSECSDLAPVADEHTFLVVDGNPADLAAELQAARADPRRTAVLVVEDEDLAAQSAARALAKFYHVDIAGDGTQALQLWRAHHHALVVLDLMLPGLSGERVMAGILADNPQQPIIIMTAHDAPETHQELMLAGAAEFISKPLDLHALPQLCARTLQAQACLTNAHRSSARESSLAELAGRGRAANYHFERGQPAPAGAHLRRAIFESRTSIPSDDQWAQLLGEFDRE